MNKSLLALFSASIILFAPVLANAATWKPTTPEDYAPITWAKAPGIASFFKAPSGSGALDFLTRINLAQNQIQFIGSDTPPADWGAANSNFTAMIPVEDSTPTSTAVPTTTDNNQAPSLPPAPDSAVNSYHNYAFSRFVAETGKSLAADAKFIWNGPFFNITLPTSDLSMALKATFESSTIISSGSRPDADMAQERRMLLVNNRTGRANIQPFDAQIFVGTVSGDQAIEGFAPTVVKVDNASAATARLFMGIMPSKQELVIYCSQSATIGEASRALMAAGVPMENQLELDGGGSASCGYNLPGQYFVEPSRTLPLLMGATSILARGVPTTNGLNVRSGPGTTFTIVRKLNKADQVRVIAEKNGWYKIGVDEWVSKSLIKKQ